MASLWHTTKEKISSKNLTKTAASKLVPGPFHIFLVFLLLPLSRQVLPGYYVFNLWNISSNFSIISRLFWQQQKGVENTSLDQSYNILRRSKNNAKNNMSNIKFCKICSKIPPLFSVINIFLRKPMLTYHVLLIQILKNDSNFGKTNLQVHSPERSIEYKIVCIPFIK